MPTPLDYATEPSSEPLGLGPAYFLLVGLNCVALHVAMLAFSIGVSGDVYAPIAGLVIGIPLALTQCLIATLPAWLYVRRRGPALGKGWRTTLLILSVLPPLITATAVVLAFTLPQTRGGGC